MAMDDKTLAWSRAKSTLPVAGKAAAASPQPQLEPEAVDRREKPVLVAINDLDPLPTPESPYEAFSRPGNDVETTLHVLLADGTYRGFAWSNFDSVDLVPSTEPFGGMVLLLRFAGMLPAELRILCCNPGRLHALIGDHRIRWIREHPTKRGFEGMAAVPATAEIITGIIIVEPWKPKPP